MNVFSCENSLLTPEQTAHYLGLEAGTLPNWRTKGVGPDFIKVGHRVRYRLGDVDAWLQANTKKMAGGGVRDE